MINDGKKKSGYTPDRVIPLCCVRQVFPLEYNFKSEKYNGRHQQSVHNKKHVKAYRNVFGFPRPVVILPHRLFLFFHVIVRYNVFVFHRK